MAIKKIVYDTDDIKALLKKKALEDLGLDSSKFEVSITMRIEKADHSDPRGSTSDRVTFECGAVQVMGVRD
jgi:hypothetical protein